MFLIFMSAIGVLALVVLSSFVSAMSPMIKIKPGINPPAEHVGAITRAHAALRRP